MQGMIPLYGRDGQPSLDAELRPIEFSEEEVRLMIGQKIATIRRGRGRSSRRVILLTTFSDAAHMTKDERIRRKLSLRSRIPMPEPYCVPEYIGDVFRVYVHVASRCSAAAPGRMPIDSRFM